MVYAYIPDVQRKKLDMKAQKLRFVGYSKGSSGYRLLDDSSKRVIHRKDVIFDENSF